MTPRLGQVAAADVDDPLTMTMYRFLFGDRDPVAEPGTSSGTPGNWWTVMANVPDVFAHAVAGINLYRSPKRRLDPVLRELAQTRVGWVRASQFVYSQHCKSCRQVGISEEMIAEIPAWSTASCFSDVQRAVLAYTDALALEAGRVPDGVFDALRAGLDDGEILELTYITMLYEMHAVMSKALRLEWDDRDDPIVEIAAPHGFDSYDTPAGENHG